MKPNDTMGASDVITINFNNKEDEFIDEEYQSFYEFLNSHFPITNDVNLDLVEGQIQTDQRYKSLLINILSEVKSDKLKQSVMIIMRTIIDDGLLKMYTYHNKRTASITKNFYELNLSDVVFEALNNQPLYENRFEEVEKEVKAYILKAKNRYNLNNKK